MIRRDYIMRMVEQVVQALLRISNFRKQGQVEQAQRTIDRAYRAALGCGPDFIASLAARDMLEMMRSRVFSPEQVVLAARLIQEEAELPGPGAQDRDVDATEADKMRLKALDLYLGVFSEGGCPSVEEYESEIAVLLETLPHGTLARSTLAHRDLPTATLLSASGYFAAKREYATAETLLFRAVEADTADPTAIEHGREFYRHLATLNDDQLSAGGLPRDEVEQGHRDFEQLVRIKLG